MADPATISAGVGIGSTILGGIFGASGAQAQGQAAQQMGMFQAGIALRNAQIAKQNAVYASVQGEQEAMRYGMGARQAAGEIRAQQGASGLDVNTGSNATVRESQQLVSSMDMAQIRQNAAKAAYDYRVQASGFQTEALGDIMGAQNAMSAARMNAESSIIGTASSVASKWMEASKLGLFKLG